MNSPVTALIACPHWKMPTYISKYHLLTPRNGRKKFRSPVHNPSSVLLWTSRTPSPSSSRAHSPALWQTVACPRPVAGTQAYPLHSSPYSITSGAVAWPTNSRSDGPLTSSKTNSCAWPVCRPTTPATGGRSVAKVPCPRRLLARRRGGSSGSACLRPFFPRVLEHLVGFGLAVGKGPAGQARPGEALQPVAQVEQVPAATAQFAGQLRSGGALGDAPHDEDDLGGGTLGALEQGAGPGVEDAAAAGAAVVEDGAAVAAVDGVAPPAAAGAAEAIGVQGAHEEVVAGLFVEQVEDGEVHGRPSSGVEGADPGVLSPYPACG